MSTSNGRFTAEAMTATMRSVAERLNVDASDAQLLRLTNNAVFALPSAGIVIRVTRSHQLLDRADKVTTLGRWFAKVQAPTIRLATGVDQPVLVDGLAATIWDHLPPRPPGPTINDLGAVLRRFHALDPTSLDLPRWDPIGDARRRLTDAEGLPDRDRDRLLDWCERLDPQITALQGTSPGLVHGDAHVGNLLRNHDGQVVLCDFDATSLGPWQVDLVAVAVGEIRFGRAGAHRQLADAYGYDATLDPHWHLLREARELKMIVAAVPLLSSAPGIAAEFTLRLRSALAGEDHARWTPFADLNRQKSRSENSGVAERVCHREAS